MDLEVPLSFRVPGYAIALKQVRGENGHMRDVAEGDCVSGGVVLARIRSSEYQDRVHQASSQAGSVEAVLDKATLDFERAQRLYADQSLTKPDFYVRPRTTTRTRTSCRRGARADERSGDRALRYDHRRAVRRRRLVRKASSSRARSLGRVSTLFALAKTDTVKIHPFGAPETATPFHQAPA